jgi:hypothetical protein
MHSPTKEEADRQFRYLGRILSELQSIEYLLRWWLAIAGGKEVILPSHVGQQLAESPITDYRSLRPLIDDYNSRLNSNEGPYRLDAQIVDIRDALAHGRILAISEEPFFTLYRFSKPVDGRVQTIAIKLLSNDTLEGDVAFLDQQFHRILECATARGYFSGDRPSGLVDT